MAFNSVSAVQDRIPLHNVIVSVFDKTGLEDLLVAMLQHCPGLRFYATGGSYDFIASLLSDRAGAHLVRMTDYTRQPEMKGGLVKTLDWRIYLGLLAEAGNAAHDADLVKYQAVNFNMVVGNLYDFRTAAASGADPEAVRQHIDIGGPSMLRAAAKNYLRVASVCKPELYPSVGQALAAGHGCLTLAERQRLAGETFRNQAAYDLAVADWFSGQDLTALAKAYQLT
ncbi:MAG: hypothetical protein A2087_05690 [Spirochaetes bacterium GWD1_61_31]|nr:MAG: hypothetical protein A2Y37_13550 [Spirochaetes bacterium GWB1_60_80]OHD31497.1 MAG: hypothetical protein A2004_13170 [Spirochaetes bacterium GWC1_61_12]OHD43273.1 MAG: hypothetical protein A2087_05690 [Spirochaetes bacterium GWD1_61_31]OHD45637.1 MAG: hypothetical protein A2Y35_09300 [Spirochaetes bacterium GWE1_60_18]OHD60488.1 MAG: hypothetical protein A2Y32_02990 [Spirochaetes bacterium GWF1_60_12]HAP44709.1 hypothetical protein [Spirochaetaceae bacterium]